MGLMDKVKAQATQIAQKTQEVAQGAVQEGKTKLDQVQGGNRANSLLRDLGAAVYAERTGRGGPDSKLKIDQLIAELQSHEAQNGINLQPGQSGPGVPPQGGPQSGPFPPGGPAPQSGPFPPGGPAPQSGPFPPGGPAPQSGPFPQSGPGPFPGGEAQSGPFPGGPEQYSPTQQVPGDPSGQGVPPQG